jgi:hypothetical protein
MAIDAKQLRAQGIYQAHAPLRSILDDLAQIGALLQKIKAQRKTLRIISGASALAGLICAIAAGVKGSNVLGFCSFLGFALALALFIYSFIYGRALIKHEYRHTLMQDLSNTLPRDAHKSAPFSARLALKATPTLIREEAWPARRNGKQQFLQEEFLSIEGDLLDGTALTEKVNELTRKRTYRNPRGKYKTKLRSRYLISLRFDYPSKLYGDARTANDALHEEIRVPDSAALRDMRVSEKAIVMKALIKLSKDIVQASSMLSMGAYRILNLARRTAGSTPGGAS